MTANELADWMGVGMNASSIYFLLGAIFGWSLFGALLQLAYYFGIVEYKGRKK
jgi:hypothetical protein